MRRDWYAPSEINYDLDSIAWLLQYAGMLREGRWPPECKESGYTGNPVSISYHAPFELTCQIIAEVDRRLAMCGLDRELVEKYYTDGIDENELSKRYHMDVWEVFRCINRAVNYISSGKCPRWMPCDNCVQREKCRKRKSRKIYTYRAWNRSRSSPVRNLMRFHAIT